MRAGGERFSRAFPRERRLLRAAEFRHVFSDPLRVSDRYFTVLARPAAEVRASSRLGLAIARKQLRRAVDRNRVKRLIREFFRHFVAGPADQPKADFVVMVRAAAREVDNATLIRSLQDLFTRLRQRLDDDKRGAAE